MGESADQPDPQTAADGVATEESDKKTAGDSSPAPTDASETPEASNAASKDGEAAATSTPETPKKDEAAAKSGGGGSPAPIVSSSKKSRPSYKYDPNKITLRFLFANRDGLTVTVECEPGDTVGEVKGALLSVWPSDLPSCSGGDRIRLICMGKGILMPDTRTLEDCQVPVFKTHPTPINVSVRPENTVVETSKAGNDGGSRRTGSSGGGSGSGTETEQASQGCACVIL